MHLYPAIDIRKGRVVRLNQGEAGRQTVYSDDPAAVALRFVAQGASWIHVVDLDRAFDVGENRRMIRAVIAAVGGNVRVQLGGGLRSLALLREALDLGIARAVVGTSAALDPAFVPEAVALAGPERLAVGVDARDGVVAVRGWTETSTVRADALVGRVAAEGIETIIYTEVARDGMLLGPDLEGARVLARPRLDVIVSGGISSLEDVRAVRDAGMAGAIIGRALYEGRFDLPDALEAARCASPS